MTLPRVPVCGGVALREIRGPSEQGCLSLMLWVTRVAAELGCFFCLVMGAGKGTC